MGRIALVTVVVGLAALGLLAQAGVFKSDAGKFVTGRNHQALPALDKLKRNDAFGAETVRAYLDGVLACNAAGRDLMARLQTGAGSAVAQSLSGICRGDKPATNTLNARETLDRIDNDGRAKWRIRKTRGLSGDLEFFVDQLDSKWTVVARAG